MLSNPISAIPASPTQSLFSRRRQAEEIRGDVILFPLETTTTNPHFVTAIKQAQQEIYQLIESDFGLSDKVWSDKASRHSQKFYKQHKKLHMSFAGIIPPCAVPIYTVKKTQQTQDQLERADQVLKTFINQPLTGKVKECKLNPDGHMVVRVAIQPAELLLACKAEISAIFGGSYNRYDDPEKQTTLAIVLGVVDYMKFSSPEIKVQLELRLERLTQELPPSYEESEREARAQAIAAMQQSFNIANTLPSAPPEEMNNDQHEALRNRMAYEASLHNIPYAPAPSPEDLQRWYNSELEAQQQAQLQQQYRQLLLNEQRYNEIRARTQNQYLLDCMAKQRRYYKSCRNVPFLILDTNDFLLMQYMTGDMYLLNELQWRLNVYMLTNIIDLAIRATPAMLDALACVAKTGGHLVSGMMQGSSYSNGGNSSEEGAAILLAIAAAVVLMGAAIAGAFGTYYASIKSATALSNIFAGEKFIASMLRLSAYVAGTAAGIFAGAQAGAALGTMIAPGAGTIAGAVIGGFSGAGIGQFLSVYLVKYTLQFAASLYYSNDKDIISPTNPNKYRLTNKQSQRLASNWESFNSERIHAMMKDIHSEKRKPSEVVNAKADYNELLDAVKNKAGVARDGFYFTKNTQTLFKWNHQQAKWNKINPARLNVPAYNPAYRY